MDPHVAGIAVAEYVSTIGSIVYKDCVIKVVFFNYVYM